jgi:heavy metal sensor kinase
MFLKKLCNLKNTLAFRLTLWYAAIFSISILLAFSVFYYRIFSITMAGNDQDLSGEIEEFTIIMANEGLDHVKSYMKVEVESDKVANEDTVFRLLSETGRVLAMETTQASLKIEPPPENLKNELIKNNGRFIQTINLPGHPHRFRTIYGRLSSNLILQVAESLEQSENYLELFQKFIFRLFFPMVLLSGIIGWFLARQALKGVAEVTQTALDITSGAHDTRVQPKRRAYEIERLANTFNAMLDRIQSLMKSMREMTDNIAHDLRSPLTRIRGIAEMTLINGKDMDEYQKMAESTVEECDNLIALINTMLDIAEIESGADDFKKENINLGKILMDACELFQPLADEKGLNLVVDLHDRLMFFGDRHKLQRMITNLLENAIKYTPSGGAIKVSLCEDDHTIQMIFEDTGIGIAELELPKIFDRFYRCDRSRTEPGIGLGLSLAKAIAKAHGGDIAVQSELKKGSRFTVFLPAPEKNR